MRRDGQRRRISSQRLVPGDIVLIESGDRVPADLRRHPCATCKSTSPRSPVSRSPSTNIATRLRSTILADRRNLAFAGTLATVGQGEGVVWATGDKTEAGRIAWLISEAVSLQTPLTRKIAAFSQLLLWLIVGLAVVTLAIGLGGESRSRCLWPPLLRSRRNSRGLPAAVTVVLAIGVSRMAARRRSSATCPPSRRR